jgi:flagellin-specific chaperone FliS
MYSQQRFNPGTPARSKSIQGYLEQEVFQWSPEKIILKTYDLFLVSAKKGDSVKMSRVLTTLMTSLNFEYKELSERLYRLYAYCEVLVQQKRHYDRFKGFMG